MELDSDLCALLRERFRDDRHVSILRGDFLGFDLPTATPYKVVRSIPLGRTAEIVRRLVDAPLPPTEAYLVSQREAAHRFAGGPHAPESLASLLLSLNGRWRSRASSAAPI